MDAAFIFAAPCFKEVIDTLYVARDLATESEDFVMACTYEGIVLALEKGMHNARVLDLESGHCDPKTEILLPESYLPEI